MAAFGVACASEGPKPHPRLVEAWQGYQELPAERALAIAGDPRTNRWVTGASGGHPTSLEAQESALAHCAVRRGARRLQEACVLYAVGDAIVWRGR
jgi:hypothetical protein